VAVDKKESQNRRTIVRGRHELCSEQAELWNLGVTLLQNEGLKAAIHEILNLQGILVTKRQK
jgi:hypothetical protein